MLNTYAREASIQDWLRLIRAEYLESPGLHLTKQQVERLWGLDALRCKALLDALVDARFLRINHAGMYTRVDVER